MKAVQLETDFWEVREGANWWTVKYSPGNHGFYIISAAGREIAQTGATGRKIVAAVYAAQQT